jgi:hypothetical protein
LATRWKSRWLLVVWALLLTCGINGILTFFLMGTSYFKKDYFQTNDFQNQLGHFIHYLNMFEWNAMPKEEVKKHVPVTPEEIDAYRYRNGDLLEQVSNIKSQYESRIEAALSSDNKEIANIYMAERDRMIEDVTNLFKSDEYARTKVAEEKAKQIDDYYRDLEHIRAEFATYKETFKYRLRDVRTGEYYANAPGSGESDTALKGEDMMHIQHYRSLSVSGPPSYFLHQYSSLLGYEGRELEGHIGVAKSAPVNGPVLQSYNDYRLKQTALLVYAAVTAAAIGGCFYLFRRHPIASKAKISTNCSSVSSGEILPVIRTAQALALR